MVCVLFFLLSPKTIPKTGVKTKQITNPEEDSPPPSALADTPAPPCRAGSGGQTALLR